MFTVRRCASSDLVLLNDDQRRIFRGQEEGRWEYLTAWVRNELIGTGVLRWEGPFLEDISATFPGQTEVGFLQVVPRWRSQGVGTALITFAEDLARSRGDQQIGLVVSYENDGARRLYQRLGYSETGVEYRITYDAYDHTGAIAQSDESGSFWLKPLR